MPPRRHQSVTRAFTDLFDRLRSFVLDGGVDYHLHQKLYIDTTADCDKAIEFIEVKGVFALSHDIVGCKFSFCDKIYFSVVGVSQSEAIADPVYFNCVEMLPGFFVRLVLEMNISISSYVTPYQVYNEILSISDTDECDKPKAINYEAVKSLFCDIQVFQIENERTFIEANTEKLLGYFVTRGTKPYLKYSHENEVEFKLIFESDNKHLPYDLILLAFSTTNYKYSFVELYRCIERIYPLPALKSLCTTFPALGSENPLKIAKMLEDELNWRPKEEESLKQLTSNLSGTITSVLEQAKSSIPEFASYELSRFIYRLRNICVHYRDALGQASISDEAWNLLILGLLKYIGELYQTYDQELNI